MRLQTNTNSNTITIMNWPKIFAILAGRSQKWERFRLDKMASEIANMERLNQINIANSDWDEVKKRSHSYSVLNQERKKLLARYEQAWGKYE